MNDNELVTNTSILTQVPYKKQIKPRVAQKALQKQVRKNRLMGAKLAEQQRLYSIFRPNQIAAAVSLYVLALRNPDIAK